MIKDSKHRIFFICGFLSLSILLIPAKRIAVLPAIEKPRAMELDGNNLFVLERYSVSIFSLRNFELIKKIGKRGEGPGEWTLPFKFKIYPDSIVINTLRKLLVFSREGSLIYELRKKDIRQSIIWPVGNHFVAEIANISPGTGIIVTIAIINNKLETLKEIYVSNVNTKKESSLMQDFRHKNKFHVYEDSIFITDTNKGFYIEVFNNEGRRLYTINKNNETEPVPVTEKIKSEFLKQYKNSDDIKLDRMFGKKIKHIFPKYFPAFKRIFINSGKIYAITFNKKSSKNEIIIMDLKGKILKRTFIELSGKCLQVFDGALYYLKDNIIDEKWELFCEPID